MDANFEGGDDLGGGDALGGPAPGSGRLAAGTALGGGRYQIVGLLGRTVFGEVYRATDRQAGGAPVAMRVITPELARDAQAEARLKQVVQALGRLEHKNIARALDAGRDGDVLWSATEFVDGQTLRALLSRKRAAGAAAFSLKGAYNVIAHVCNGMTTAHQATHHGALSAANVLVNSAGRVKITEFGLARAFPGFARLAMESPADLAAVAPEMATAPHTAGVRADVYSIGAILYELLTGREVAASLVRPSQVVPGLPAEIDQLIARCLAPNPADRLPDVAQLKTILAQLVESRGAAAAAAPRGTLPPGGAQQMAAAAASAAPAAAPRPSTPQPRVSAPQPAQGGGGGGVAVADENEEKWLIQKDRLDFGPFSFAAVKQQIIADQIVPGNIIIDNENGQRCRVEDHPLLHDLILAAEQKRDDLRRAHAEVKAVKQDKTKHTMLYAFIGLGVIGLGLGGYFIIKAVSDKKTVAQVAEFKELDSAEMKSFTLQLGTAPPKKSGGARSGGGQRRPSGDPGMKGGFDDSLDLGDASEDEESERLDNSQINPVLQRYGSKLGGCLVSTGSRSGSIEFIIGGNGRVTAVRVNGQTNTKLANCVRGVMSKMQFPTFNGPRTRAQFDMSL